MMAPFLSAPGRPLIAAGRWLSHTRTSENLMETRSIDVMNRLNQTGGAGTTVVEGTVNELADVTVNNQPAELKADLAAGGYRYRKAVAVTQGSNYPSLRSGSAGTLCPRGAAIAAGQSVNITAVDKDNPPNTVSQNWQFNVPSVQKSFTYDANGNTLSDGTRTFTWYAKNRLKSVAVGASAWSWDYDYRDRRVKERLNGTEVKRFIWNDNDILQERTGTSAIAGTITRNHFHGGFTVGASVSTAAKYQALTDHLGNVREVIVLNAAAGKVGAIAARYDYSAYQGPVKVGSSTVEATFQTIGRYYHHEGSGLELALYRAYDPELGRWLSEDPLEERGGINLYEFVVSNPISFVDQLGLTGAPGGPGGLSAGSANPGNIKAIADAVGKIGGAIVGQAGLRCIQLRRMVKIAKAMVSAAGGACLWGDTLEQMRMKHIAWSNAALARRLQMVTCFAGGDAVHQREGREAERLKRVCEDYMRRKYGKEY